MLSLLKNTQKLVPTLVATSFHLTTLLPKFTLKDLSIGSGSIIGKDNIEEFFNHVSKHEDIEEKSIAELDPNYEIAATSLVHMLEARFDSLNPMMQILFLKLKEEKNAEKREFILETLLKEFHDVAKEAKRSLSVLIC